MHHPLAQQRWLHQSSKGGCIIRVRSLNSCKERPQRGLHCLSHYPTVSYKCGFLAHLLPHWQAARRSVQQAWSARKDQAAVSGGASAAATAVPAGAEAGRRQVWAGLAVAAVQAQLPTCSQTPTTIAAGRPVLGTGLPAACRGSHLATCGGRGIPNALGYLLPLSLGYTQQVP